MARQIDDYAEDEKEFLRTRWNGCERLQAIDEINIWRNWELKPVATEVIALFLAIGKTLHDETIDALRNSWSGFQDRFVVSLDTSNSTKSAEKILEKMVRDWLNGNRPDNPSLNRHNYKTSLKDAIRLRYEVNFLEDGNRLCQMISRDSKNPATNLYLMLELKEKKCNVNDPLPERKDGDRSWKFQFLHKATKYCVELQICTQLQVAWDKKDHFLIYERSRKGLKVPGGDVILMKHVSDQLYVVDRQLDELRDKIQSELGDLEEGLND
jgi:ppGpp synthetase/RelA/SpoT-type nucleotidyltranferase